VGALEVGGLRAIESMGMKRFEDRLDTTVDRSGRVDIIDAYHPQATVSLGVEKTR